MMRRAGSCMVEVMVALGVGSALMPVAIGMVHRAMTVHATARMHASLHQSALRLSRQFRSDVNQADNASLDGGRLLLSYPDGSATPDVVYTVSAEFVSRLQQLPTGQLRRESFRFESCPDIEVREIPGTQRFELAVSQSGLIQGMPARVVLQVQALLGRRGQIAKVVEVQP